MSKERWTRRRILQTSAKFAALSAIAPLAAACAPPPPTPEAATKSPELSTSDKLQTAEAEVTQIVKLQTTEAQLKELKTTQAVQIEPTKLPPEPNPTPKPVARPTVVDRELTPSPQQKIAQPTAKPTTAEAKELPPGKLWQRAVHANPFSPLRIQTTREKPQERVSSFSWNEKSFLITAPGPIPKEINLADGKDNWLWQNQGYVYGGDEKMFYFVRQDTPRIYALDAATKQEMWKINIPTDSSRSEWLSMIRWPVALRNQKLLAIQRQNDSWIIDKQSGNNTFLGGEIANITEDKLINSIPSWQPSLRIYDLSSNLNFNSKSPIFESGVQANNIHPTRPMVTMDNKLLVFAPAGPVRISKIQGVDITTGKIVWDHDLVERGLTIFGFSLFANQVIVHARNERLRPYYLVRKREDGEELFSIIGRDSPVFFEYTLLGDKQWFFTSDVKEGITAFRNGQPAWQNDEIVGATEYLGETDSSVVFLRHGSGSTSPAITGMIWAVEKTKGKDFTIQPVKFPPLTTDPIRAGGEVILPAKSELSVINLKTGQKRVILAGSELDIRGLVFAPSQRLIFLESGGSVQTIKI